MSLKYDLSNAKILILAVNSLAQKSYWLSSGYLFIILESCFLQTIFLELVIDFLDSVSLVLFVVMM